MEQRNPILSNKIATWGLVAASAGWIFNLLLVAFSWNKLPPQIPFLYSLPWGEAWLIAKENLIVVLAGFAGILIFNLALAKVSFRTFPLLQNFLIWGAAAAEFMLAVDLVKIIGLLI